jgi:hypothetical protein
VSELPPNAPDPVPLSQVRRSRLLRRVGLGFVALIVLAGAVGLLGIRTRTVTASGGGYSMTLQYPWTDRSDQPVHWVLAVRHPGGFSGPVSIGITASYLDLLDMNGLNPQPSSSKNAGPFVVWTFDPPSGDVLRVMMDANIQLDAHFGAAAEVAVLEHGVPAVSVDYRTWVSP